MLKLGLVTNEHKILILLIQSLMSTAYNESLKLFSHYTGIYFLLNDR